jgi:uncharacterized membrane protein YfcA
MDILTYILILATGLAAGFINVMAGGGSSLTLPLLIFLGMDPNVANGTNRIAIAVQNISAVVSFKSENISNFKLSGKMAVFTIPGAVAGALLANNIESVVFEKILGVVILLIVINMLIPRKKGFELKEYTDKLPGLTYLFMFLIGFYGGFIQVGIGFIIMAVLYNYLKMKLVFVNMHKVLIVLIYTVPALLIFIFMGNIDYVTGFVLAVGNSAGAFFAAKMSVKKGDKIIKRVLIVSLVILSIKLFGIF